MAAIICPSMPILPMASEKSLYSGGSGNGDPAPTSVTSQMALAESNVLSNLFKYFVVPQN